MANMSSLLDVPGSGPDHPVHPFVLRGHHALESKETTQTLLLCFHLPRRSLLELLVIVL